MQEQLDQIIFENVSLDSVGDRDIFYNDKSSKVTRSKVDEHFQELILEHLPKELQLDYLKLPAPDKRSLLIKSLVKAEKEQRVETGYSEVDVMVERLQLYVVQDGESQDHIRVWDAETKNFDKTYSAVKTFLGEKKTNELPKYLCTEIYNPMIKPETEQIEWLKDGQIEIASVNRYIHPSWRVETLHYPSLNSCLESKEHFALPSSARAFFEHLLPEEKSRHYVYEYLYHALTERNGCEYILVLHGPTGTGKTIFADDLMRGLFGDSNWGAAPKNLFKSAFNKVLLNKRIIYLDEGKVSRDTYATVKLYANTHMNIEKKGVDADNTSELFFSLIVSANTMGDYYIHYDDRRSSIVETSDRKLKDIWSDKEIVQFKVDLREEEYIGAIGNFILSRSWVTEEETEVFEQFKGDKFYKFVYRHLSSWEKNVLKSVEKSGSRGQEEITISSLLSKIDNDKRINYDLQEDTLLEFLSSYEHQGKYSLGEVKRDDEGDRVLKIDSSFIVDEEEDEGEDLL